MGSLFQKTALLALMILTSSCTLKMNILPRSVSSGASSVAATPTPGLFSLFEFPADGSLGAGPGGDLLLMGSTWYGMTSEGGVSGYGTIFSIPVGGGTPTILYSFTGGADGGYPGGSLSTDGSTLYGMTASAGAHNFGTIFSFVPISSTFNTLYDFTGGVDGKSPNGSLVYSGGVLYGLSAGSIGTGFPTFTPAVYGAIFSYDIGSTVFTVLHSFSGAAIGPYGSLVLNGTILYGVNNAEGTLFSFDLSGPGFSTLYSVGDPSGLVFNGGVIYGTTTSGGANNYGGIYSYDIGSLTFTNLYDFTEQICSSGSCSGSLIMNGTSLYGMTTTGGTSNWGTVFSYDLSGPGYSTLYSFTGADDGGNPSGGFILYNGALYGMTAGTGSGAAPNGTIFGFQP